MNGVEFTVTRTGDLSESLTVTISVSDGLRLVVPKTVVIPAGQDFVTFIGSTVRNDTADDTKLVEIVVSADNFETTSTSLLVVDVPPVLMSLSSLVIPELAEAGSEIDIKWLEKNIGKITSDSRTVNVYVSTTGKIAGATLLAMFDSMTPIDPNSSLNDAATITLPSDVQGTCWIIVELVVGGRKVNLVSPKMKVIPSSAAQEVTQAPVQAMPQISAQEMKEAKTPSLPNTVTSTSGEMPVIEDAVTVNPTVAVAITTPTMAYDIASFNMQSTITTEMSTMDTIAWIDLLDGAMKNDSAPQDFPITQASANYPDVFTDEDCFYDITEDSSEWNDDLETDLTVLTALDMVFADELWN